MADVATNAPLLIDLVSDVLGTLSLFPLNIMTAGMVIGIVFGIIRKTKKIVK